MRKLTLILPAVLMLKLSNSYAGDLEREKSVRLTPVVNEKILNEAEKVSDFTLHLWSWIKIPREARMEFDQQRTIAGGPGPLFIPQVVDEHKIIEFISVKINKNSNCNTTLAEQAGEAFSKEQKHMMTTAAIGDLIDVEIKFRFIRTTGDNPGIEDKIFTGTVKFEVVPETEAGFPGGFDQFSDYMQKNVFDKVLGKEGMGNIYQAQVKFTVDEYGAVKNGKIVESSGNADTDRIVLEAINKMPVWVPAENPKNRKVKQDFHIYLQRFGGC